MREGEKERERVGIEGRREEVGEGGRGVAEEPAIGKKRRRSI